MTLFVLILSLFAHAVPALAGEVSSVEIDGDRVIVRFDDVVASASALVLANPDRIAVDIAGATARAVNRSGAGIVRSVRQAQFDPSTARVVLDMDRPASVGGGEFSADGRSLILQLVEHGPQAIRQIANAGRTQFVPPAAFRAAATPPQQRLSVRLPGPQPQIALPPVEGPDDNSLPLVVIDAGHGGHDPGSISPHGGHYESQINLAMARRIRDRLIASGRARVAMTRDRDEFLVLEERFGIARRLGADLFISVHADSAESQEARGATIYTLSETASDREAALLARRENRSDIINGVNLSETGDTVSSILIDLTQRETMNASADFARLLRREGDGQIRFRSDSHRFAAFVVLKAPDVPSILLETGFVSNADDVNRLRSEEGQQAVAQAVSEAVTIFFARRVAAR